MTVTIGSLDNVPSPGSSIASPWAQEISGLVVHRFASITERDATWPSPPNGAVCYVAGIGWQRRHAGAWATYLDGSAGLLPVHNAGGATRIKGGNQIYTTTATGLFTIAHGLGTKPAWWSVLCADRSSAGTTWYAATHDATTDATSIDCQARDLTGAQLVSKSIRAVWVAGAA